MNILNRVTFPLLALTLSTSPLLAGEKKQNKAEELNQEKSQSKIQKQQEIEEKKAADERFKRSGMKSREAFDKIDKIEMEKNKLN